MWLTVSVKFYRYLGCGDSQLTIWPDNGLTTHLENISSF